MYFADVCIAFVSPYSTLLLIITTIIMSKNKKAIAFNNVHTRLLNVLSSLLQTLLLHWMASVRIEDFQVLLTIITTIPACDELS